MDFTLVFSPRELANESNSSSHRHHLFLLSPSRLLPPIVLETRKQASSYKTPKPLLNSLRESGGRYELRKPRHFPHRFSRHCIPGVLPTTSGGLWRRSTRTCSNEPFPELRFLLCFLDSFPDRTDDLTEGDAVHCRKLVPPPPPPLRGVWSTFYEEVLSVYARKREEACTRVSNADTERAGSESGCTRMPMHEVAMEGAWE